MNHEDTDEDLLAGIDLHAWRVPPALANARPPILQRALAPAQPARTHMRWLIAALVIANAVIAALVVIILLPDRPQAAVVAPAGGGSLDAHVAELVRRLETEQRELERRIAEIEEMRAVMQELQEKLRRYEDAERRDRTVAKDPKRDARTPRPPAREPAPAPSPAPGPSPAASAKSTCDEVSCVLENYPGPCCLKYRKPLAKQGPFTALPELDRSMISAGVASVKAAVRSCGDATTKGVVKVTVEVADTGIVRNVRVLSTPDAKLGQCVAGAVQQAVFARTVNGGSFSYPFVF
jgi:hypothetical protein